MSYSPFHYIGSVFWKRRPIHYTFFLTKRCNAKCPFCFYLSGKEGPADVRDELSLDEIRKVSSSMGDLLWLAFSGGEIFLRDDLVEVKIKFDEDMPNDTLKGKELLCKVTITDGKKKNLPPLDDEFAESAECKNMEELKKKIHDSLKDRKENQINLEYKKEIINELLKRHDFDVPASMVKGEIDSLVDQVKQDAMRRNEPLKSDEELAKELETTAKDNIRSVLILEAIGKKDSIETTDDDVKKAVEEISARNNLKTEEVMKLYAAREGSLDAMKSRLFADKVMDFILEKSTIES